MDKEYQQIADILNALDMVRWDRCTRSEIHLTAYGWIDREDAYKDFVIVFFELGLAVGQITSSARWSVEISRRLFVGHALNHRDCERIEDVFAGAVACHTTLAPVTP